MIAFTKGEIPFTILLLPFVAGLVLAISFPLAGYQSLLLSLFCIAMALFIGLNLAYQKLNIYKHRWLGGLLMHVLLLITGIYCFNNNRESDRDDHFSRFAAKYLVATITSAPKLNGQMLRFTARVEQAYQNEQLRPISGHILIVVKTDSTQTHTLAYGDQLLMPARFTDIEPPRNPGEFNYKSYMANQNVYQQAYLNIKQVTVLQTGQGNPIIAFAQSTRLKLVDKLKISMRDTDAIAVASTMLLGYRADLRADVRETYAKTGTMHLLSVAGMHVGLVYLFISFILSFLVRFKHGKIAKIVLSILLIWCYALITGFSPAVCRACLMLSTAIIGLGFSRHISRLNVLAVSAFMLLLYNPFYIADVGFQLSYLAVGGIIIIQPYLFRWVSFKNRWLNELWMVCTVSIAAQLVLFPIGAFYFHDFPVYFLASNLFVVIPSAIIMFVGIVYLALPAIPLVSSALAWLIEHTVITMTKTLAFIEHAPYASINRIWLSPIQIVLCYALLISLLCLFIIKNKVWLKIGLGFALLIAMSLSMDRFEAANSNTITFYSVNKSTGILLQNGAKGTLLTDMQPGDRNFQYSVRPGLDSSGIEHVTYLTMNEDTATRSVAKAGNLLQLGDKKILLLDKAFARRQFRQRLDVDYIYITGSPKCDLQYLIKNYNFKMLIAGNNNSAYIIKQLENEAVSKKMPFFNLKRNNAFITASNNNKLTL